MSYRILESDLSLGDKVAVETLLLALKTAEKYLEAYKKHIRENAISCTTCAKNPDLCHGCTNFIQGTDVLLWEPEVSDG
jgi:hypothetical protein